MFSQCWCLAWGLHWGCILSGQQRPCHNQHMGFNAQLLFFGQVVLGFWGGPRCLSEFCTVGSTSYYDGRPKSFGLVQTAHKYNSMLCGCCLRKLLLTKPSTTPESANNHLPLPSNSSIRFCSVCCSFWVTLFLIGISVWTITLSF